MSEPLSDTALDTIFRTARSYNGYLDKPVSETQLRAIWDLMRWGPTSVNMSPARIVWVTSPEAKERLAALASAANQPKVRAAPVTAIIGYDLEFHEHLPKLFPHLDARPWFADPVARHDAAYRNGTLQGAYFIIAARALGLDTGPMSGIDLAAVTREFFGGTTVTTNFISTLGYGDPSSIFGRVPRFTFEEATTIV